MGNIIGKLNKNKNKNIIHNNSNFEKKETIINHFLRNYNYDEIMRVNDQQFLINNLFKDEYYYLDIENDLKVLDIGCGNNTWCYDIATKYKNWDIIGIDIDEKVQDNCIKPENFIFGKIDILNYDKIENYTEIIKIEENIKKVKIGRNIKIDNNNIKFNNFDYIHMQLMTFSLFKNEWEKTIDNAIKLLKTGGYFKIIEHDINIYKYKKEYDVYFKKDEKDDIFIKDYLNNKLDKLYEYNQILNVVENNNFYSNVPFRILEMLENKKELKKINYKIRKTDIGWGSQLDKDHFKEACESVKESIIDNLYIDDNCDKNVKYKEEVIKIIEDSKKCKGIWTWHEFIYVKL